MANAKRLWTAKVATGEMVYAIVRREKDGFLLDASDGLSFSDTPVSAYLPLTEDGTIKGLYEVDESSAAWDDGRYKAFLYIQAGGSPDPGTDTLADVMDFWILGDRIVEQVPFEAGTVEADPNTSIVSFKTNLPSAVDSYCSGSFVKFTSGNCINQTRRITSFGGTTKMILVSSGFTEAPAPGDTFIIVNQ